MGARNTYMLFAQTDTSTLTCARTHTHARTCNLQHIVAQERLIKQLKEELGSCRDCNGRLAAHQKRIADDHRRVLNLKMHFEERALALEHEVKRLRESGVKAEVGAEQKHEASAHQGNHHDKHMHTRAYAYMGPHTHVSMY